MKKYIPEVIAKSNFKRKVGNKSVSSDITPKKIIFSKNKASFKITTKGKYRVYIFNTKVDYQKLSKVFYPPCDLKIIVVPSPNTTVPYGRLNYRIIITNLGPGKAYNLKISSKLSKLNYVKYSLNGVQWKTWHNSLKISELKPKKSKIIYIRGYASGSFLGTTYSYFKVNNSVYDLNYKNNEYKVKIKVKSNVSSVYCGPNSLQFLLNTKGIDVSSSSLSKQLNTNKGATSFYNMIATAKKYGIGLIGVNISSNNLKVGDIALLKINGEYHFVNIIRTNKTHITIVDPVLGPIHLTKKQFNEFFTGKVLISSNDKRVSNSKVLSTKDLKNTKGYAYIPIERTVKYTAYWKYVEDWHPVPATSPTSGGYLLSWKLVYGPRPVFTLSPFNSHSPYTDYKTTTDLVYISGTTPNMYKGKLVKYNQPPFKHSINTPTGKKTQSYLTKARR